MQLDRGGAATRIEGGCCCRRGRLGGVDGLAFALMVMGSILPLDLVNDFAQKLG